jgi:predicted nucleic acid-binding protein
MRHLLDTCVISEFTRPRPEQKVVNWLNEADAEETFLSVVTLGEVQHGISRLQPSNRRTQLEEWVAVQLTGQFAGRILSLDAPVFIAWGQLVAGLEKQGKPMSVMDSLIAAQALYHRMTLVTRNTDDFVHAGIGLLNPWE